MQSMEKLRTSLINDNIEVDALERYKSDFEKMKDKILVTGVFDEVEVESFLRLCLDYYAYNTTGDVMISDREYDQCMQLWKRDKGEIIIYPDPLDLGSQWLFRKHDIPGLVGSLDKIYDYDELKAYCRKYDGIHHFIIAPKFDGISVGIHVMNGEIHYGTTRYDGIEGQDITELLRKASNANTFYRQADGSLRDGYYKCEIAMSTENLTALRSIKPYKNRRSATSGIVNTPKNIPLGQYITIVPLLYFNKALNHIEYAPIGYREIQAYHPRDLLNAVETLLSSVRQPDYPYRVDGVVIYPIADNLIVNEFNLMQDAIAYKINTNEAKTNILFGYMSIGRLGKATPMVRITPTEVNEVTVEDASLSSYAKYVKMGIHDGEEVIVYSAGDVIPQIKLQSPRVYNEDAGYLKIKRRCPYCDEKLERVINTDKKASTEYHCANDNCKRIITGRIANFVDKLGVAGFSDKSIEDLYDGKLIKSIDDLFRLTLQEVRELPGYSDISATNLVAQMQTLQKRPLQVSTFIGALGIPNISETKTKKMLEGTSIQELTRLHRDEAIRLAASSDGIGFKTAEVFVDFIRHHKHQIIELLSIMNIKNDHHWNGSVVFTKFTNADIEKMFNDIGYEIRSGVTKSTTLVICGSMNHDSGNCKAADRYGIPIYDVEDVPKVLEDLREYHRNNP